MKQVLTGTARVVAAVLVLTLLAGGGALVYLDRVAPEEGDLESRLVDAQAELKVREAALEACEGPCDEERRALEKQQTLVEVIQQEL